MEHDVSTLRILILGVAASDSHAVANHLIAHLLRCQGFAVVNLGTCTTMAEFADAYRRYPSAEAVIIGSVNGHAYEDLLELPQLRREGELACPVILGGNLWVGCEYDQSAVERLIGLGVDVVLRDPRDLPAVLERNRARRAPLLPH